jgi:diguanylate cyclase (GGDEF)-like protein
MTSLLAKVCLTLGTLVLAGAMDPLRKLMALLPQGSLRRRWYLMTAMIGMFMVTYVGYAARFWNQQTQWLDLMVPGVFLFGAWFVWLAVQLALHTALDVRRTALLEQENITDPLTGTFNRRHLARSLRDETLRARRYDLPLSLIFIDVDHFKQVNDTLGHQAGDQVLVGLAQAIRSNLRDTDLLARFGGEEFVIMMPHTPLAGAAEMAERLVKNMREHDLPLDGGLPPVRLTCSAGVAALLPGMADGEHLLRTADEHMYRAKQLGRNQVVIAEAPVAEALMRVCF